MKKIIELTQSASHNYAKALKPIKNNMPNPYMQNLPLNSGHFKLKSVHSAIGYVHTGGCIETRLHQYK